MPKIVPQENKTPGTVNAQPRDITRGIVQNILALDIAGWKPGDIAEAVGLTGARTSVIMHTPVYEQQRLVKLEQMKDKVVDGVAERALAGDPVKMKIKALALDAINTQEHLMKEAGSESDAA